MRSGIAAKFLGIVNKDKNNTNQEDSGNIINERFTEAKVENLYQGLRSVRHTNSDGMGNIPNIGLQDDELSLSDDDESQMSMPKIDDKPFGMSLINEAVEGEYSSGDDSSDDEEGARIFGSKKNESIADDDNKNEHCSDFIPARVELNMSAHRQGSDISLHSTSNKKTLYREESDRSTHSNTNETWASSQASLGSSATGGRFLRALGIGQRQESTRSVNNLSNSRRSSNDSDDKTQKSWFGTSFKKKLEDHEDDDDGVSDNAANIVLEKEPPRCSATDHHAKSRSNFTKRTVQSITTSNDESFRMLQQRMKEKGAVTANSVRHMLQEAAEEHVVKQEYVEDGDLNSDDGEASINIDEVCLNDDESEVDGRVKSTSRQQHQTSWFNNSVTSFSDNIANKTFLRRKSSEKEMQQAEDPMFGCNKTNINSSGVHNIQPYITIPSRETSKAEILFDVVRSAADKGESRLLTVHGSKFVGKTRLLQNVIDTGQINGFGYTVLTSTRTSNDTLTSFFSFREVISTALRMCDAATQRSDESFNSSDNKSEEEGEDETDVSIVRRLIQRKISNKNDQLMIGRILPEVMNDQLLSLLKGRNPVALTKDVCESLFKILIPLQPVMLVFESEGDECDIDPSSWDLIGELLLSAGKQCPQLLCIMVSRQSLSDNIPTTISDKHVIDVHIDRMDRHDTECYIRALFCDPNCIDRNTEVDENVVDGIYNRARGCPLFTERLVLWAKRKSLLELDERRNAVALHFPNADSNDYDNEAALFLNKLPDSLNEEILEVINNLPDHSLDALKLSACLGLNFDLDMYTTLKDEGLYASLQEIISSLGIFELIDGHYFRWKHVAVYEAVQSIIISNERRELHGQIADSLRNLTNVHNSRYARHSVYAALYDDAFDRYMSAGDEAEKKSDYLAAVGFYQQAKVCLSKSSTKPTLRRRLSPYAALGWCLRELIRYDEAEMELEYCQSECSKVSEEKRNQRFEEIELDVTTSLATLKQAQSKYSEAIDLYERALPIARANVKKHSKVWLANHVASCAETHRKSGDLEEAKRLHQEALEYREEAVKEHSCTVLELATSYNQLGCTMSQLGYYDSAYSLHKKALSARAEHLDFSSALVSESLNYCADALQALGKGRQGIPLGMHAVKIRHHIFGPHHPAYAHALSVLASCYHSVGRSADALSLLTECLVICEKAFSSNHANLIPNLLLYGKVLIAMGKCDKAKEVYTRALDIHQANFNDDQNRIQLIKLQDAIEELYCSSETTPQTKVSIEMPMPSFEPDSSKTHVVACVDIGTRASDELMLSVAASLQEMGSIKLMSVIAVSPPQVTRSNIARGALDSLMLSGVSVAYSGVVSTPSSSGGRSTATSYNDDYGKPSAYVNSTGIDLLTRALLQAPSKSLVILCTACLGDVSEVITTHRELFTDKVKQVVILGSVTPIKRKCFIEPEEGKSKEDTAATYNVYQTCQEMGISTLSLCKDISQGFPFPSSLIDDLTTSNHMVSNRVQHSEEMHVHGIWELIKQYQKESKGYRLPPSKTLDIKAFYKYALGGKNPSTDQPNIWSLIKSINLELVFGLLSCIPAYQDAHFRWDSHEVKGVQHKICRHANSAAGIIKPEALSNEIHMLVGFSFRTSLLNTSC